MHHITYLQCQDEVLLNPIPRFLEFIVEPHDQHGVQGVHNRDGHAKEVIVPSPRDGLKRVLSPRILFVASPCMLEHVLPCKTERSAPVTPTQAVSHLTYSNEALPVDVCREKRLHGLHTGCGGCWDRRWR